MQIQSSREKLRRIRLNYNFIVYLSINYYLGFFFFFCLSMSYKTFIMWRKQCCQFWERNATLLFARHRKIIQSGDGGRSAKRRGGGFLSAVFYISERFGRLCRSIWKSGSSHRQPTAVSRPITIISTVSFPNVNSLHAYS